MGKQVLGAAIFGAGWVATQHARAYLNCSRTNLIAIGSRREESARQLAESSGATDAFICDDFEAILQHPEVDVRGSADRRLRSGRLFFQDSAAGLGLRPRDADHHPEPLDLERLARAAGIGIRSLQLGFQRHFGISISQMLQDIRLAHLH
ncbi:hypothetical protein EON80_12530, partial [bacterium]